MSTDGSASPRKSRANKIYRTPPTPEPEILHTKEKTFVLDCNATSSISSDYSKANPKLGPVVPPYNSQRDPGASPYFSFIGVQGTLRKTGQDCVRQDKTTGKVVSIRDVFIKYGESIPDKIIFQPAGFLLTLNQQDIKDLIGN